MSIRYGTDIVKIERIRRLLDRKEKAAERLFTAAERMYAEGRGSGKYASYAAMFAAKEAVIKALQGGGGTWHEIEVRHAESGAPYLQLTGTMRQRCEKIGAVSSTLSLSHEREYAIAGVILWGHGPTL